MFQGELAEDEDELPGLTEENEPAVEGSDGEAASEGTEASEGAAPETLATDDQAGLVTQEADPQDTVQSGEGATPAEAPVPAVSVPVAETPEQPAVTAPEGPVASEVGRVQISFVDDCWIRITDAQGKRLVNALKRSGDQVDVAGEPPLRLVVGAVSAVDSIRFQGVPVNISGFTVVNNRSEFTLEN